MTTLPHLAGRGMVTDGGMETDLIFHRGVDLPCFASFPLLEDDRGRELLTDYYAGYADVAARAGAGLLLETPTWRANQDWGDELGYSPDALRVVNERAVEFLHDLRARFADTAGDIRDIVVGGMIGPHGDGYRADDSPDPDRAAEYHSAQVTAFAAAGAEQVVAYTLTDPDEAIGVVRAARSVGLPVAVSFTVETDGRLPDGIPLGTAIERVDTEAPPDYFMVNCAHPSHVEPAVESPGHWRERVLGVRSNASRASHAELDEAEQLDDGDPAAFGIEHLGLRAAFGGSTGLTVLGGCCGTDVRHVAVLWGVG